MNPYTQHRIASFPCMGDPTGTYKVVTSAADVFKLTPSAPIQILRWGMICTTTVNDATAGHGLKLTGDVRITAGSDSGRVTGLSTLVSAQTGYNGPSQPAFYYDTAGGSIKIQPSATQVVAGNFIYHTLAPQVPGTSNYYPDADTYFVSPGGVDTQLVIYPGQEFIIGVVADATVPSAGAGSFFCEFLQLPFQGTGYSGATQIVPSSISPTPSNATNVGTRYFA